MDSVILVRLDNGRVEAINDDGEITVFPSLDEAVDCAVDQILCKNFPYQVVELDEL